MIWFKFDKGFSRFPPMVWQGACVLAANRDIGCLDRQLEGYCQDLVKTC